MDYKEIQKAELESWIVSEEDPIKRREKAQRESIRYPLLRKQMGLDHLDTSWMHVADIGAGPLGGVSSVINCKSRVCIDPLSQQYSRYFDTHNYLAEQAEDLKELLGSYDLIITTNCVDHFENPFEFLSDLAKYMKPGAYYAQGHAINNHITHPHPAHRWGLTPEIVKEYLWKDFELVWNLDFQNDGVVYGWLKQPAMYQLWRKVTGY